MEQDGESDADIDQTPVTKPTKKSGPVRIAAGCGKAGTKRKCAISSEGEDEQQGAGGAENDGGDDEDVSPAMKGKSRKVTQVAETGRNLRKRTNKA